jgi:hypothetical protein
MTQTMIKTMNSIKIALITISALNVLSNIFIIGVSITNLITKLPLQSSLAFTLFSYISVTISFFLSGCLIIDSFNNNNDIIIDPENEELKMLKTPTAATSRNYGT